MKKILFLAVAAFACLFVGCENENTLADKVVTVAATDITAKSVVLHGVVNVDIMQYNNVEFGMMVATSETTLENDGTKYPTEVLSGSDFKVQISNLKPNTQYYYCAYIVLNGTTHIGSIMNFETSASTDNQGNTDNPDDSKEDDNPEDNPEDEPENEPSSNFTAKAFSISSTKQVYFSPGNLQYHPKNDKWRFAEQQWDIISIAENRKVSQNYDGWIDLFCWGTGKAPLLIKDNKNYYKDFYDWGINTIGNDQPNTWRTLSYEEWSYLISTRKNANQLIGPAIISGDSEYMGIILLPDGWKCPTGIHFESGFKGVYWDYYIIYQNYTIEEWRKIEDAGGIFLPKPHFRISNTNGVEKVNPEGTNLRYWSYSLLEDEIIPVTIKLNPSHGFTTPTDNTPGSNPTCGIGVRLVKDL